MKFMLADLRQIKTSDGIVLEGIVATSRQKKAALIWLHGLSSKFYSDLALVDELSKQCPAQGIGYFKFNMRGHDVVTWEHSKRYGYRFGGSAFEKFEKCILDIRSMINFARRLGYKKIALAGHSTGANKALYYLYKTSDPSVKGLMLLGPISDIAAERKRLGLRQLKTALVIARKLKDKKPLNLMPLRFGLYSAKRYWSLYHPGEAEDVFPYHNKDAKWSELKNVKIPLAVVIGSRDEYLDRPAKKLIEIFRDKAISTKSFTGFVVKNASHSFPKKEKELGRIVLNWIIDNLS